MWRANKGDPRQSLSLPSTPQYETSLRQKRCQALHRYGVLIYEYLQPWTPDGTNCFILETRQCLTQMLRIWPQEQNLSQIKTDMEMDQ